MKQLKLETTASLVMAILSLLTSVIVSDERVSILCSMVAMSCFSVNFLLKVVGRVAAALLKEIDEKSPYLRNKQ